jgi:hypothetical protein
MQNLVNAHKLLLTGDRYWRSEMGKGIWGLALHKAIGQDALIFVLLHEAGHHLAQGPRLPFCSSLACECASDAWAVPEGAVRLSHKAGRTFSMEEAICELGSLMPARVSGRTHFPSLRVSCWQSKWKAKQNARRRIGLSLGEATPIALSCCKPGPDERRRPASPILPQSTHRTGWKGSSLLSE